MLRIATYDAGLTRRGPGLLLRDILRGGDAQIAAAAAVIAAARPDVLLLTSVDYDHDLRALSAFAGVLSDLGMQYPHRFAWRPNTGRASGLDLDGDGRIDQYGSTVELWLTAFEPFVWCWGGAILNQDNTRSALHGPRVLEAAQFIYDMKFVDKSTAVTAEMEGFMQEAQLLTGRLGMAIGGTYMIQTLDAVHGGMRWGIAPIPYGPYGDRATRATFDGISVYSKSTREKKDLAWEFIKFVLSADSQRYFGERRRGIPVHRADAVKYYVREDAGADEMLIIDALNYAKLTPITPFFLELRNDTQPLFDAMNLGKVTPAEAVPRFDGIINKVLAKEIERWGTGKS